MVLIVPHITVVVAVVVIGAVLVAAHELVLLNLAAVVVLLILLILRVERLYKAVVLHQQQMDILLSKQDRYAVVTTLKFAMVFQSSS